MRLAGNMGAMFVRLKEYSTHICGVSASASRSNKGYASKKS